MKKFHFNQYLTTKKLLMNSKDYKKLSVNGHFLGLHSDGHMTSKKKLNYNDLTNTDELFNSSLSLPFHKKIKLNDIDFISKQVINFFNEYK